MCNKTAWYLFYSNITKLYQTHGYVKMLLSFLQTPEHRFDTICSSIMEEVLILLHYAFERMLIYQYIDIREVFIT